MVELLIALCTQNLPAIDPPERLARLLRLGADGLALGPHPGEREAACAASPLGRVAWRVIFVSREPRLAATDRHECDRAVAVASAEMDRANRLECAHVALDLGVVDGLSGAWGDLCDAFARGRLDGDGSREFLAQRRQAAGRPLDALRRGLDRLLPLAERRGSALGLLPAAGGDALGLPDEVNALLGDYAGAPLVRWRATDRGHRLHTLGLGAIDASAASGAIVADAAGAEGGLPPGRGEVDWTAALRGLPDDAPRVLWAERATEGELAETLAFLRGLPGG